MKKLFSRIKKKPILVFTTIFFLLYTVSSLCLIYSILRVSNIENILRYLICAFLLILNIYFTLSMIKITMKGKNAGIILYDILFVLLFLGMCYSFVTINGLYDSISNMYKNTINYSVSLISKDNNLNVKDIKDSKIAIINNSNTELNEVSNLLIDKNKLKDNNEIVEYENTTSIIKALYDKEVDLALLPSNYVSIFSNIDEYKDINDETYEVTSISKKMKKNVDDSTKNENDPITILVLGIDSTIKDISTVTSFNADSIMLITFNPKTYNATILSIPRDTYVPIICYNNAESKITHSGWNGESCVISTLENLMDINIDYYVKVNFTAVVNLVDEIGGVEIDVPYSFCEQDSQRRWREHTVYVEKGIQTLNGEQALALSRNRHPNIRCGAKWTNYYSDDIVRGENQQKVLNAIINKMVKNLSIEKSKSILNIIGKNVDTNMKINEMTSYYNVLKKVALNRKNVLNFEKMYLSTYGKNLYDPLLNMNGMSMQIYYKESLNAIINAMKTNLGLMDKVLIKTFDFSVNNPYKEPVIGKGNYQQQDIQTVPNFVGKDVSIAQTWATNNGINLIIDYKEDTTKDNNIVISQSISSTYRMDMLNKNTPFKVVIVKNTQINE